MITSYKGNPDSSPVLSKTRGQQNSNVIHTGGTFWSSKDMEYKAVRQWIAEGARNN